MITVKSLRLPNLTYWQCNLPPQSKPLEVRVVNNVPYLFVLTEVDNFNANSTVRRIFVRCTEGNPLDARLNVNYIGNFTIGGSVHYFFEIIQ